MDFTQHLQFHFKPKPSMAAVSRGIRFEVCYSQALSADTRGRANFISNVTSLIRATRGRGLMISSEAKDVLSLRAPADVVNLLSVWGLGNEKGMQGLGEVPRSVVVNEGLKRNGFRGVINIVGVAEEATGADDEDGKALAGKKNKNKAQNQNQNQKRKNGEEESQQVSKRQAKKMKLASRTAGAEKK
jgi:ribonuclease P/MRP protein subunit RPP1